LNQSHFVNPDGLPDPPGQLMSALDLAKLARHLINDYPQYYHYFGEKSFIWHKIVQPNRNLVLEDLPGADGLKTGHTDLSGYGITVSAKRGNERLILVLNGLRYPEYNNDYFPNIKRSQEASRIMEMAFREFRSFPVLATNQIIGHAPVLNGSEASIPVTVAIPLNVVMQADSHRQMKTALRINSGLTAPVHQGQRVGSFTITAPDFPALTVPLYAARGVAPESFLQGAWHKTLRLFGKH
jgi:D-alanyl-D-alanine carboxypeptidase (penicillin-binding protein 5/6)